MADGKVFLGNGKVINTKYGEMRKLGFSCNDVLTMVAILFGIGEEKVRALLADQIAAYESQEPSSRKWVNIVVKGQRADESKLYGELDTWVPTARVQQDYEAPQNEPVAGDADTLDDGRLVDDVVPF